MSTLRNNALAFLAAIGIISCSNSERITVEVHTDAVDFTEFNQYLITLIEDSEGPDDLYLDKTLFPEQDIEPSPDSDNTIQDKYHWNHADDMAKYREVYNINIIGSNIVSIMETVERAVFSNSPIPSAKWVKKMIKYDPELLQLTSSKEWLTSTVDYLNNTIDIIRIQDSISEDIDLYGSIFDYMNLINDLIENDMPNPQTDSVEFEKISDQIFDWREYAQNEDFVRLCNIEDERAKAIEFLNLIGSADNFKSQCAYALCAVMADAIVEPVPLIVLDKLVNSGHYSEYQYQTWLGWRSLAQINCYGRSRDSDIADQWYNQIRKSAMLANLAYMDAHPDDLVARLNFLLTSIRSNIIRNGSFIMGSDVSLDFYEVFR